MTPFEFDFLRALLKERSGLALADDKRYLVESRLVPVLSKYCLASLSDLVAALRAAPGSALASAVAEAMTTNESLFFRDKIPFENFRTIIMPALIAARANERRIRVWCAAASCGQEPYSLAMMIREHALLPAGWQLDILATDLSAAMVSKAKEGIYSQFEVQRGLPIGLLLKYFTQAGERWQLSADIRAMVKFQRVNLLDSFAALGRFDVIFCRNVLIYFDRETKIAVLDKLGRQLAPDGYLLLGAAETVIGLTPGFAPLVDSRGVYVPATARIDSPPLAPNRPVNTEFGQPLKTLARP